MNEGILRKQRAHAEEHAKKLGRTENYYEVGPDGEVKHGVRRMSQVKNPPNVRASEIPVGRKRGVCKPGDEY
jgi:hypothetical protein